MPDFMSPILLRKCTSVFRDEAKGLSKIDAYIEDRPRESAFLTKLLLPEFNRRVKAIN